MAQILLKAIATCRHTGQFRKKGSETQRFGFRRDHYKLESDSSSLPFGGLNISESRREFEEKKMGKVPVRMKAVVYGLSPFQQKVMPGLWKDLPSKIHHKISENWHSAIFAVGPIVGTYAYVQNYKEKEKLENRF